MVCPKCGAKNRKGVNFCTACGGALKKAPHVQRKGSSSGSGVRAIAVVAGLLLIGLAMVVGRWGRGVKTRPDEASAQVTARPVSLAVRGIASKFWCSCGECGDRELADCTCPSAVEGRAFIDRELKQGTPEPKLIEMVNGRYGRLKAQYASPAAGASGESPAVPAASARPPGGVATEADAQTIASRFICACAQCQNHVLSECDCDHPKGAVEMKAFIRYKISQKRHTVDEVVKAVAYEYGHLIQK